MPLLLPSTKRKESSYDIHISNTAIYSGKRLDNERDLLHIRGAWVRPRTYFVSGGGAPPCLTASAAAALLLLLFLLFLLFLLLLPAFLLLL